MKEHLSAGVPGAGESDARGILSQIDDADLAEPGKGILGRLFLGQGNIFGVKFFP